jgi:hypothetical protein
MPEGNLKADIVEGRKMMAAPFLAKIGDGKRSLGVPAFEDQRLAPPQPVQPEVAQLRDDVEGFLPHAWWIRSKVVPVTAQPRDDEWRGMQGRSVQGGGRVDRVCVVHRVLLQLVDGRIKSACFPPAEAKDFP